MVRKDGVFIIEDIDFRYFNDFENYITSNKHKYNYMELVKITNEQNKGDNNIILIIK